MRLRSISIACAAALVAVGLSMAPAAASGDGYKLTRLVSDKPGVASHLDPNLVNAWGLVAGPSTPWWVANNGTNTSTLYDGTGTPLPLVVKVAGAPTGTVFNDGDGFVVSDGTDSAPALFLFDTERGTIRGWSPGVPPPGPATRTFKVVDNSGADAIYKGLAIASTNGGDSRLYATDFHNARVDMFDEDLEPRQIAGAFEDPNIPLRLCPVRDPSVRYPGGRHVREARRGR